MRHRIVDRVPLTSIRHAARGRKRELRRVVRCGVATVLAVPTALFIAPSAEAEQVLPWRDTSLPPEQRAALLLGAMTLDQKLQQIFNEPVYNEDLDVDGDPDTEDRTRLDCDFTPVGRHIEGIPELGIPDFRAANGGTGIRGGDCSPEPVATPPSTTATWL